MTRIAHERQGTAAESKADRLAQGAFVDFAGGIDWQHGDALPAFRGLIAGQRLPAMGIQGLVWRLPAQHHDRADHFTPACIGQPDHGAVVNRGVFAQDFLDFTGGHILAPGDDHVFLAINHVEITLVIETTDIPGVQPAPLQRGCAGRGIIPIAEHALCRAHQYLAAVIPGSR